MSLQPSSIPPVPEETARVARAAFRKGNVYLRLRDELGALYEDSDFTHLFLKPPAQHEALQGMRERITSEEGRALYRARAGVEGTISQALRIGGLRQARYRGQQKILLQSVATAAAVSVARLAAWWEGRPHAPTRISRFPRLAA